MSNLNRRLSALEATMAPSLHLSDEFDCDTSHLTDEQRKLVEDALAEQQRLAATGSDCSVEEFVAGLALRTKRAIACIRLAGSE